MAAWLLTLSHVVANETADHECDDNVRVCYLHLVPLLRD